MASASERKYCHRCGREVPVDAEFCPYCGTALSTKGKVPSPIRSKSPLLSIGVLSLALGIVIFFIGLVIEDNYNPLSPSVAILVGGVVGMIVGGLIILLGLGLLIYYVIETIYGFP